MSIKLPKDVRQEIYQELKKKGSINIVGVGVIRVTKKKGVKMYDPFRKTTSKGTKTYISLRPSQTLRRKI